MLVGQKFANNATARLVSPLSAESTMLVIEAAHGGRFPQLSDGDWFRCTLEDAAGNIEIITVATHDAGSPVFSNITRAREGTNALAFMPGSVVQIRFTAEDAYVTIRPGDKGDKGDKGDSPVISPLDFDSIADAVAYASSLAATTKSHQQVSLLNKEWVVDSPLILNSDMVGICDGLLKASPSFADAEGELALIRVKGGLRHVFNNLVLDCSGVANGILCDDAGGFYNLYEGIEIKSFKDFGIRLYGGADQRIDKCLIWQNQEDTSKRTGIGIDVLTGDVKIHNSVVRYCGINLHINGHTTHCTDNHFYNGNSGALNPARNSINVRIDGGFGHTFGNTYLDKGSVILTNASSQWVGTRFLFAAQPDHDAIFFLESNGTIDKSLADSLPVLSGGTFSTAPLNYKAIQLIKLVSNNGGSWSADSHKLEGQINALSLVDLQPEMDAEITESKYTILSRTADYNREVRFGNLTESQNDGQKINERYASGVKEVASSGLTHLIKSTGQYTSATQEVEGSRSSASVACRIALKNRYGATTYDETSGTTALVDYMAASGGYAGELQFKLKAQGTTSPTLIAAIKSTSIYPGTDNAIALGSPPNRYSQLFAGNATINTSDEREKTNITEIDVAVLRAWSKVRFCQYQWIASIAAKGESARIHFGVIAQEVKRAFEEEGLDPFRYGVLCYDEWDGDSFTDDGGCDVLTREAGNRYGIRYEQALIMECALMRKKLDGWV